MRSLFLKIFLWFWLMMVLINLASFIAFVLQPEIVVSRWQSATSAALSLYGQQAIELYDRSGPPALADFLHRLDRSANIRAYLFDSNGQPLHGNPPADARELASRAIRTGEQQFEIHTVNAFGATMAIGPSGTRYVMVAVMPRPRRIGALFPDFRSQPERWILPIVISGLICYLLARYLTRPIVQLRTATRQLAAGDLSARAAPEVADRRDELGDLVADFNQMAERIEALLTSQRQLISDISHELRSPLARLTVALELARNKAGNEASVPLDRIELEAERLNEMIGKLLTIARLESATEVPQSGVVSLSELVKETADDASFEARSRKCEVRVTEDSDCTTPGSPDLLRSAIENVVRNAVRYTEEGTAVEISLSCSRNGDRGWAVIRVRDHGPGVPEKELANVFQPFYRVENARERQKGGTGLGLAITDRAIRLHGGSVKASNAEGGGLVVEMRLPLSKETHVLGPTERAAV